MGWIDRVRRALADGDDPEEDGPSHEWFASVWDLARAGATTDAQRAEVGRLLRLHGVPGRIADAHVAAMVDGIALLGEGTDERLRLGGPPVMPPGAPWPMTPDGRPLSFVAALDFAAVPPTPPLPEAGVLLLFWDFSFHERDAWDAITTTRVWFVPAGERPVPTPSPASEHVVTAEVWPLRAVPMPFPVTPPIPRAPEDPDEARALDLVEALSVGYGHGLLGASQDQQGPVLDEVESWLAQASPELRARYSPAELRGEGWTLLAQITEDGAFGFGDPGQLYVVLPEVDLGAHRFDRAMTIMQT
jgi:hypothetical protein